MERVHGAGAGRLRWPGEPDLAGLEQEPGISVQADSQARTNGQRGFSGPGACPNPVWRDGGRAVQDGAFPRGRRRRPFRRQGDDRRRQRAESGNRGDPKRCGGRRHAGGIDRRAAPAEGLPWHRSWRGADRHVSPHRADGIVQHEVRGRTGGGKGAAQAHVERTGHVRRHVHLPPRHRRRPVDGRRRRSGSRQRSRGLGPGCGWREQRRHRDPDRR